MTEKETREIILDVAEQLFYTKGYEETSMAVIQKKSGIARGTLYYHFEKKEDILDEVIERQGKVVFARAEAISKDKSIPVIERLVKSLLSMSASSKEKGGDLDHIHSPANALLHQKVNNYIVEKAGPFLTNIVEDGVAEGIFNTDFPKYAVEMILIYVNIAFDHSKNYSPQEMMERFQAFSINIHRLLGAEPGSIDFGVIMGGIK